MNARANPTERAVRAIVVNFIAAAEAIVAMMLRNWEIVTVKLEQKKQSTLTGKYQGRRCFFGAQGKSRRGDTPPPSKIRAKFFLD